MARRPKDDTLPSKGNIQSLRRLFSYLRPYRGPGIVACVALVFTSGAVLGLGGALRYLIDEGMGKGNPHLLDRAFLFLLGVTLLLAGATYARYYLVSWIGERVVADIRRDLFGHILRQDLAFFETTRTGELLSRLTTDTTLLQNVVGSSLSVAARNTLMLIGGVIMLTLTSAKLAGYVLLIVPVVVVPIIMVGRRVRQLSRDTQARVADLSVQAEEHVSAIRSILALAVAPLAQARFESGVDATLTTALSRIRQRAALTALVIGLVFGAIVLVLWIGGHDVVKGTMSPGELSSFVFYAVMVAASTGTISDIVGDLQRAAGAAERIMQLMAEEPKIVAPAQPLELPTLTGAVQYEQVRFSYPTRLQKNALAGLTLSIAPGEKVAVVGPSGAGKSTLMHLLLRFYDPQEGRILVDGHDIRQFDPIALRRQIGFVPQDPVIFSADAWENIRMGRIGASDEDVLAAAEHAAARDFIEALPEGFSTYLGEKGTRLSGGQRQRLAIARAFVRDPRILLLDEATSALDSENETRVQAAIARLMQGRTTLVVAHRLATVQHADRIVVMENGAIQAIGTHRELLASSPLYAKLAAQQFGQHAA